jgi:manganese transport protein
LASTVVYLVWAQPVTLVLVGATGQALMLPFLGVAALRFQHARGAQPGLEVGRAERAGLWLSALAMGALGAYQAWSLLPIGAK